MGDAAEIAHDHAEAVVQWHGDHQAIFVGKAHQASDEVAIVEDVVMAERRAFGIAGRAGGVLDVDRIVELLFGLSHGKVGGADLFGDGQHVVPGEHAGGWFVAQANDGAQVGQASRRQAPRLGLVQFGQQVVEHGAVVGAAELWGEDQGATARLVQGVLEFVEAVGRVDVDQDGADLTGGELSDQPFGAVGCPDADTLAFRDPQGHQPTGAAIHVGLQIGVGVAQALLAHHQGLVVGKAGGDGVETIADGYAQQGHVTRSAHVAPARSLHTDAPPRGSFATDIGAMRCGYA